MKTHRKIYKKPKSTHTASAGSLLSWLQGGSDTRNTGKVQHDIDEAGMQQKHNKQYSKLQVGPP